MHSEDASSTYVCMYVCMYAEAGLEFVALGRCFFNLCMYVCTYACMYAEVGLELVALGRYFFNLCIYVCMYVRMYVCMYVGRCFFNLCICMYVCVKARTCIGRCLLKLYMYACTLHMYSFSRSCLSVCLYFRQACVCINIQQMLSRTKTIYVHAHYVHAYTHMDTHPLEQIDSFCF